MTAAKSETKMQPKAEKPSRLFRLTLLSMGENDSRHHGKWTPRGLPHIFAPYDSQIGHRLSGLDQLTKGFGQLGLLHSSGK